MMNHVGPRLNTTAPVTLGGGLSYGATVACRSVGLCEGSRPRQPRRRNRSAPITTCGDATAKKDPLRE
jgi:hypothetical protein